MSRTSGTQHADGAVVEGLKVFLSLLLRHSPGNGPCRYPGDAKKLGKGLSVAHVDAEENRLAPRDVLQVGVDDQAVARGNQHSFLDVAAIVLNLVEADFGQVHVREHPEAADRNQFPTFDRFFQGQPVGAVLEQFEDRLAIGPIGRGRQPKNKTGLKMAENPPVCRRGGVMRLVNDQVVEAVNVEVTEVFGNALD
jgi:hypothetical protein